MPQKSIDLNNAKAGSVLAKAVEDSAGRILCREGTTLSDKLILRFLRMGIEKVIIKHEIPFTKEDLLKQKKLIEKRFILINEEEKLLFKLKKICIDYYEKKVLKDDQETPD